MPHLRKCRMGSLLAIAVFFGVSMGFLHPMAVVFAQTAVTGELNGVVVDSTGAVVPGATVTLVDPNTGDTRAWRTNDLGFSPAHFLRPGFSRGSSLAGDSSRP